MSTIYVDESAGSDETGKGTAEQPYQTLAFAIYAHSTDTLLIRKDPTGTYEEPTQSSLKKAKKGADGLEKKRKKAEELAEREAKEKSEERERRERLLEESKKIVLEEDPALPKATKVVDPSFWRLSDHSSEKYSQRSRALSHCEVSAFVYQDGYIVSVIRRESSLSSFGMELVTFNVCYQAKWYAQLFAIAFTTGSISCTGSNLRCAYADA